MAWLAVGLDVRGPVAAHGGAPGPVLTGPFFESLGSNGRACASCHDPADGWTVTPRGLRVRFDASDGLDPVFRPIDAATCPGVDVSTVEARRLAYSLLLARGLIRVARPVPASADFAVLAVDTPYGCGSRAELSVYRRPLPVTNYDVLATVMWDGRHTVAGRGIDDDLAAQVVDATLGHVQAPAPPGPARVHALVEFQRGLAAHPAAAAVAVAKTVEPVRRGEGIFKTRAFLITGVGGLNDQPGRAVVIGFCATCHHTPAGVRAAAPMLDIGVNDAGRWTADLPLFTLRCRATGAIVATLDPGRALVTGACGDIGKIKTPVLRGLAARAPYFHNGSARTLLDLVEFYDARFRIRLGPREKADLVAFLSTL